MASTISIPKRHCGKCATCLLPNCGKCKQCRLKKEFGGNGKVRNRCLMRLCDNKRPAEGVSVARTTTSTVPDYTTAAAAAASFVVAPDGAGEAATAFSVPTAAAAGAGVLLAYDYFDRLPEHVQRAYQTLPGFEPTRYLLSSPPPPLFLPPRKKVKRNNDYDADLEDAYNSMYAEDPYLQQQREMAQTLYGFCRTDASVTTTKTADGAEICAGCLGSTLNPPILAQAGAAAAEAAPCPSVPPPPPAQQGKSHIGAKARAAKAAKAAAAKSSAAAAVTTTSTATTPNIMDDIVLLCDGAGCGREYHLKCCIPPLVKIPSGELWYCRDCSKTGSTTSLIDYLDQVDTYQQEIMNAVPPQQENKSSACYYQKCRDACLQHLLRRDAELSGLDVKDIPSSELDRINVLHYIAQLDAVVVPTKTTTATATATTPPAAATTPASTLSEIPPHLGPDFMVGKPIQLYVSDDESELLHQGRIVDYRLRDKEDGTVIVDPPEHCDDGDGDVTMQHEGGHTTTATTTSTDNAAVNSTVVEYLVRFASGANYRKTAHQHWIVLEEHRLAVGTTLVYLDCDKSNGKDEDGADNDADNDGGNDGDDDKNKKSKEDDGNDDEDDGTSSWQPAIVWLHTARALLAFAAGDERIQSASILDRIRQTRNQVRSQSPTTKNEANQNDKMLENSNYFAFCKPYCPDICNTTTSYLYRDLATQAVGFFSPRASAMYTSSDQDKFWGWMAMVECQEQESVRLWRDLPLHNMWLLPNNALQSHDDYALGPLEATMTTMTTNNRGKEKDSTATNDPSEPALCPLVSRGLDRLRILELLDRQGIDPTKDVACTLSCRIVSISSVAAMDHVLSE